VGSLLRGRRVPVTTFDSLHVVAAGRAPIDLPREARDLAIAVPL